jgi:hypothetical protein
MQVNTPISQEYIHKVQLKYVWKRGIGVCEAKPRFKNWIEDARGKGVKAMIRIFMKLA